MKISKTIGDNHLTL